MDVRSIIAVGSVVNSLWDNPVSVLVLNWVPGTFLGLLVSHAVERVGDIGIESLDGTIIVVDWVWLLVFFPNPMVLQLLLGVVEGGVVGKDGVINTKVWNWVVHWVSLELRMLILGTSC